MAASHASLSQVVTAWQHHFDPLASRLCWRFRPLEAKERCLLYL